MLKVLNDRSNSKLKKIDTLKEFEYFFRNFEKDSLGDELQYNKDAMDLAQKSYYGNLESGILNEYEKYQGRHFSERKALLKAYERYNNYIDFRLKNPSEFLCVHRQERKDELINIKNYPGISVKIEWISLFELDAYLDNNLMVYIIRDKNRKIEKSVKYISEIN
ncbi:hypothetical protein [Clostridium massiliamazoniense]|uniref:hypothetical protein n=1 Tax=Clostridium massiliamazoniense TaxID=1347366 RepID=UPI0006D76779|nr:hypothetical protein [Clostridium massiliamazoniense]